MNTSEVKRELQNCPLFRGVFPRNSLKKFKKPYAIVVNTDSDKEIGEHWVAVMVPKQGKLEYFDPMGWPPPHRDIINYLTSHRRKFQYCCYPLQGANSIQCGRYCIAFIKARQRKISYQNFISRFKNSSTFEQNDVKVTRYLNKLIR